MRKTAITEGQQFLTTHQAAEMVGLSPLTLNRYRVTGEGPAFHRFGGLVRYTREDLDRWARTRRRRSNTAGGKALGEDATCPGGLPH